MTTVGHYDNRQAPTAPPPQAYNNGMYNNGLPPEPPVDYNTVPVDLVDTPKLPPGGYQNGPGYPQGGYPGAYPPTGTGAPGYAGPPPDYRAAQAADAPADRRGSMESEEQIFGKSFSEKKIRHNFIKKVYLILLAQLTVTVGFICLFVFCNPVKEWVKANSWFYWISYAVFLCTYIVLICIPSVRRNSPGNFICLAIFTLALSYMAATISSYYDTTIVLYSIAITAAVCLCISLFAIQTKIDFTMCSGLLFALLMVLILFGFACFITWLIVGNTFATYVMNIVYGGLAALVFSLFLVFDTQMVVGGKNRKFSLSPEEYITGALQLYLDIVYLLLIIMGLTGAASN